MLWCIKERVFVVRHAKGAPPWGIGIETRLRPHGRDACLPGNAVQAVPLVCREQPAVLLP